MRQPDVIKTLTKDVLEIESPYELNLVDQYDPKSSQNGKTAGGQRGFGISPEIILLLPIIYRFFEKFLDRLATNIADGSFNIVKEWARDPNRQDDEEISKFIRAKLEEEGVLSELQLTSITNSILVGLKKRRGIFYTQAKN